MQAMGESSLKIDALSAAERLELLERLWESLSREPTRVPLTEPQQAELERRLDSLESDLKQGGPLGVPWNEVVRQIRNRG
jgi:putative addiction module component (TIGR02574 family)